jgi:hypothetical protein
MQEENSESETNKGSKDPNLRPTTRAPEMSIFAVSLCLIFFPEAKYVEILHERRVTRGVSVGTIVVQE